jgi:hypothetical protein
MGWWSVRGSVTISSRGSSNCFWIWLVNVPGVWRPAMHLAPVYCANLNTARWPVGGGSGGEGVQGVREGGAWWHEPRAA